MAGIQTRITYPRDGEIDKILNRLTGGPASVNRTSVVVRRIVLRWQQMLDGAGEPDANLLVTVGDAIVSNQIGLLWRDRYPERAEVLKLLEDLPLPKSERDKLCNTIKEMPYADYARLIEAIEMYHLK